MENMDSPSEPRSEENFSSPSRSTRVFISFAGSDVSYARDLAKALRELDFDARLIVEIVPSGTPLQTQIKQELLLADALIVLWSERSSSRDYLLTEAAFFRGAASDKPLIPIILDDAQLPTILDSRVYTRAKGISPEVVALDVAQELRQFEGNRTKQKQIAAVRKEEVERKADKYIKLAIDALTKREERYQRLAFIGYVLGYLTLGSGLVFTAYRVWHFQTLLRDLPSAVYIGLLTLSAIGFLAAASKYAFVLGRSFMVESLRNNDRTHALRFGEFYLNAFSENLSWPELKEAFQYWNVDTGSGFKDLKEDAVDPQILKSLTALVEAVKK